MLVEGLYSIKEGGQLKWTVYVRECEGMRTTPGKEDEESESGSTLACGRAMANGFSSSFKASAPPSPLPEERSGGGVADGFRL